MGLFDSPGRTNTFFARKIYKTVYEKENNAYRRMRQICFKDHKEIFLINITNQDFTKRYFSLMSIKENSCQEKKATKKILCHEDHKNEQITKISQRKQRFQIFKMVDVKFNEIFL